MFCGNHKAIAILEKYMEKSDYFSFVLVEGPSQVGKSTAAKKIAIEKLGLFAHQDFLHIKDLSSHLKKKHTIKVDSNEYLNIDDTSYHDKGARQISEWLSTSPAGKQKIVLIENIERMTVSAANALLKSLEEPLASRQIVATTSQPDKILETIRSRAVILRFLPVEDAELEKRVETLEKSNTIDHEQLLFFAAGKPGRIYTMLQDTEKTQQMITNFADLQRYYEKKDITRLYKLLQQIEKEGNLQTISEAQMSRLSKKQLYDDVDRINNTLRMVDANVQKDAVLFSLALQK